MEQLGLEGEARARTTDPWTSHAAARSIPPDKLRASQRAVHECFMTYGPMWHDDLVETYEKRRDWKGWPRQSESGLRTRTKELRDAGYIEDTGETVQLPSGRQSKIWRAT
jgi:hypothetical protein